MSHMSPTAASNSCQAKVKTVVDYPAGDYTPTPTGKLADPAGLDLSTQFLDDITGTPR